MTVKRTFSLPDDVSGQLDQAAGSNASAFVSDAIRDKVAREAAAARIREAYGEVDPQAYEHWVRRFTGVTGAAASTAEPEVRAS